MLCHTCKKRLDCIPATLATHDTYMFTLLEQLKKCDRYRQEQPVKSQTSVMSMRLPLGLNIQLRKAT